VILPLPSSLTTAPLNVIPETGKTVVIPSPTDNTELDTIPVISTLLPSLFSRVKVSVPLL
jgi:hypothetical protein